MSSQSDDALVYRNEDGSLGMKDSTFDGVATATAKRNCLDSLETAHKEKVDYFKKRITELGLQSTEVLIVVINADDPSGQPLADLYMPNTNWQEVKNSGILPFVRGIVFRGDIQGFLDHVYPDAGQKLRQIKGHTVVIIDYQTAEVVEY